MWRARSRDSPIGLHSRMLFALANVRVPRSGGPIAPNGPCPAAWKALRQRNGNACRDDSAGSADWRALDTYEAMDTYEK
jgi:hypothetical protein